jgi:hypothetical protein
MRGVILSPPSAKWQNVTADPTPLNALESSNKGVVNLIARPAFLIPDPLSSPPVSITLTVAFSLVDGHDYPQYNVVPVSEWSTSLLDNS